MILSLPSQVFISLMAFLTCLALIALVFKGKKITGILTLIVLAGALSFLTALARDDLGLGCSQVTIASRPFETGGKYEFVVKSDQGKRAVLQTEDDKLFYNDRIEVCLESVQNTNLTKAKRLYYLAKYKTPVLYGNVRPKLIKSGSGLLRLLYFGNDYLSDRLKQFLKGDDAVLARGLILGGSGGFSKNIKTNLQNSGTSHLVAVSGYNVSIITIMLFGFVRAVFSRRAAIITTITAIIIFCLLTGGSASVVRASIMGLIFILAKLVGRRGATLNSLFVAALAMSLINPYVIFDVGFQLSFAATFGLILGAEVFSVSKLKISKPYLAIILEILFSTVLAQVFTLPILLSTFGKVSLVAPITNLLILPIVPLSMAIVALTLIFSFVPYLSVLLAEIAGLILNYILYIINFFGSVSFAKFEARNIGPIFVLIYYFALLVLFYGIGFYRKKKYYEQTAQ